MPMVAGVAPWWHFGLATCLFTVIKIQIISEITIFYGLFLSRTGVVYTQIVAVIHVKNKAKQLNTYKKYHFNKKTERIFVIFY